MIKLRKHLWVKDLLGHVKQKFDKIKDVEVKRQRDYTLTDCLMSGVAMFNMKYPSLLQFDTASNRNKTVQSNLKSLFQVTKVPSDTQFRERLDVINPNALQIGLNTIITQLQRGKELEAYQYIDNRYLVAIDGTGIFYSDDIHCDNCCEKAHRGSVSYYHQALSSVIVNPDKNQLFPIAMEFIEKQDGDTKNDCELNAGKRVIAKIKTAHPHLRMRVVCDALYVNGPFIELLRENDLGFIIFLAKKNHKFLFESYDKKEPISHKVVEGNKTMIYKFCNDLPLNKSNPEILVNAVEYIELVDGKRKFYSTWITDIRITESNVAQVVKGARSRWRIENETFNTLKNQGYNFEHNFGHGKKHLCSVLAYLMMIAFSIDQVQEYTSEYFELALKTETRKLYLWEKIRSLFFNLIIDSWEVLYRMIIERPEIIATSLLSGP